MGKKYIIVLTTLILLSVTEISAGNATIKEEQQVVKTYPLPEPDPAPIMARLRSRGHFYGGGTRVYPYTYYDKYSKESKDMTWNVIHMENPYIEVFQLPQIGGKVWGAVEKSTGGEFIYKNSVMKFREMSLRGSWIMGGLESNFGVVGHIPQGSRPVDYTTRENPDGSVSCITSSIDLPSRTRWWIITTVPKDKAFFERKVFWYNPTPLDQSYYSWLNKSVVAKKDLQVIVPGLYSISHRISIPAKPWPVQESGRDVSWWKNNDFGFNKSYFVFGKYENFRGGYWHDSDFGYGHWALHDDIPGQKIWIWSLAREGAMWEDILTDGHGQHLESQNGRLLNQNDHMFFTPYTADFWREVWFPYKKTGGMVKANPYGVLNVTQVKDGIKVALCPLQKTDDELTVTAEGKEIFREHLKLEPMQIYEKTIASNAKKGTLQVNLAEKIQYCDDPNTNVLHRPFNFHRFKGDTTQDLYLIAENYQKRRGYSRALNKYFECLAKEPLHTQALCNVAEIYCRRGEYEKALPYARKALDNLMYDPQANYIYGVVSRRLGNLVDAKETLGWATRSMMYRSAAYCQLGEICLLEGNLEFALEYLKRAIDFNKYDINAYEALAVTYRKLNQPQNAKKIINELLEIEPLNHTARFELFLLEPNKKNLENFKSMIRNEFPHENYIEMALFYNRIGLNDNAIQLLKESPAQPMVYYRLAYLLKDKNPNESQQYLNKASEMNAKGVYPFREESISVLQWAVEKQADNWKPKYYLAMLLWGKERVDEARELLEQCGQPEGFYVFYMARANLMRDVDKQKALDDFRKAVAVDKTAWRARHRLIAYYNELGMLDEELKAANEAIKLFPNEGMIQTDVAFALVNNKLYEQANEMFKKIDIVTYEDATEIHDTFVRGNIYLALEYMRKGDFPKAVESIETAKLYPEELGTGAPFEADFRIHDYLEMVCYEKMNQKDKVEEIKNNIYEYTLKNWTDGDYEDIQRNHYFGALVLRQLGKEEKAAQLLNEWEANLPGFRTIQWYQAKFGKDEQKANELESKWEKNLNFQMVVEAVKVIEKMENKS